MFQLSGEEPFAKTEGNSTAVPDANSSTEDNVIEPLKDRTLDDKTTKGKYI